MRSQKKANHIALFIALTLVALNVARILAMPITCDEAPGRSDLLLTYKDYVLLNKVTANIHILNSILRKASIDLLGNSVFALRLPNLLAQCLFLYCGWMLICRLFRSTRTRLAVFLLLNLNPFLFEFWGYSRGYGLAIAFMTASLYAAIVFRESRSLKSLVVALLAAMAAVWSNFALLNFYLAFCAVIPLYAIWKKAWALLFQKIIPVVAAATTLLYLLIHSPIQKLRASGELYYGGERGLFYDTLRTIVRESLGIGYPEHIVIRLVCYLCVALIIAAGSYWAMQLFEGRKDSETCIGSALYLLLVIPLIGMKLQHVLLGTKYLIDRTALFLSILFLLQLAYWIYHLRHRIWRLSPIAMTLLVIMLLINFCYNISLTSSRMWYYDVPDLKALQLMDHDAGPRARPIRIRVNWMHMPTMDYYVYTRYGQRFVPLEYLKEPPGPADTAYDYIYVYDDESAGIPPRYRLLHSYDGFNVYKNVGR